MAEIDGTWFGDGYMGYSVQGVGYPDEINVRLDIVFGPNDEYTGSLEYEFNLAGDILIEQRKTYDIIIEE